MNESINRSGGRRSTSECTHPFVSCSCWGGRKTPLRRCVEVFAQDEERFELWMTSDANAAEAKLGEAAAAPGAWRAVEWQVRRRGEEAYPFTEHPLLSTPKQAEAYVLQPE